MGPWVGITENAGLLPIIPSVYALDSLTSRDVISDCFVFVFYFVFVFVFETGFLYVALAALELIL